MTYSPRSNIRYAYLIGNPNTGKSTLFNQLTKLRQKTGNYPGVTVEKKTGHLKLSSGHLIEVVDLPGTYNLGGFSVEEKITCNEILQAPENSVFLIIADASNLYKGLLLASQIIDLQKPCALVLNMMDVLQRSHAIINYQLLSRQLGNIPVFPLNARIGKGMEALFDFLSRPLPVPLPVFHNPDVLKEDSLSFSQRAEKVAQIVRLVLKQEGELKDTVLTRKIDDIITHPVYGTFLFLFLLFVMFQAIFSFSEKPMEWIEWLFAAISNHLALVFPSGVLKDLLISGVLPGIAGIVIFLPQIIFLFLFISLLEESGYMARISFMMDKIFRPFGLNGKAIIPLMSGMACAVPSIMGTRVIENTRERLISILIIPLISCSARLPIYTLLISLLTDNLPSRWMNLKGILLLCLYLIGFLSALLMALLFSGTIKNRQPSFFFLEMPLYKMPQWKNIAIEVWLKAKSFLIDAGRIIFALSIFLWSISSYRPGPHFLPVRTERIEDSYLGILGQKVEPLIAPLGFDWKIGVGILSSFAAREVFVGTMATLYSVEQSDDAYLIKEKMKKAQRSDGKPVFDVATILSLLVFYAYAMQCMATFAIVKKETNSWSWPLFQLILYSSMAYLFSFCIYQWMS